MMAKIDHKLLFKPLYSPSRKPEIIDVPAMNFIMVDGHGDPNHSQEYQDAVSALFGLAYSIKFAIKKTQGIEYAVMPLEGLWWVENMADFSITHKEDWQWTAMIMQPETVSPAIFESQREEVIKKKGLPMLDMARFVSYAEGPSVQMMHIGPFSTEGPNVAAMHAFAKEQGYSNTGKHHEIYLSDVRKAAPEKLKTVMRQPIKKQI
jgi:hypothetical protein